MAQGQGTVGDGTTRYLTVRGRILEEPWGGDEEVLLFRSSSDRSLPLSEPGLLFSALSMSYLVARGDTGTGETWHPNMGRCPSGRLGMFCSAPAMEHRPDDKGGHPQGPPSPAEPQGRLIPALGTGHPVGTYATEHWAKARYSSSTSSPLFSSLRNSWTQLEGAEG